MQAMRRCCIAILLAVGMLLSACATGNINERDYFPGNSPYYSFGIAQSKENFANVKIAQVAKGLYSDHRTWGRFGAGIAPGTVIMLQGYFPFSVRWELKDGRQFILENIDVRSIMKDYFREKSNDIALPWQKEGRPQNSDDYDPALVYEIQDDSLRIKWLITEIKTPIERRYSPSGARLPWDLDRQQYLIKEIKGSPTQGIDFSQDQEFRKNINRMP
jgi:hypothetical protein